MITALFAHCALIALVSSFFFFCTTSKGISLSDEHAQYERKEGRLLWQR
jgi:hypothetical protein